MPQSEGAAYGNDPVSHSDFIGISKLQRLDSFIRINLDKCEIRLGITSYDFGIVVFVINIIVESNFYLISPFHDVVVRKYITRRVYYKSGTKPSFLIFSWHIVSEESL